MISEVASYFFVFLVTSAGWGLQFSGDGKQLAKSLKLATLQVNPKSGCEDIFSKENLKAIGLGRRGIRGIQRQLRNGFTNEIICVGNEWLADVRKTIIIHII